MKVVNFFSAVHISFHPAFKLITGFLFCISIASLSLLLAWSFKRAMTESDPNTVSFWLTLKCRVYCSKMLAPWCSAKLFQSCKTTRVPWLWCCLPHFATWKWLFWKKLFVTLKSIFRIPGSYYVCNAFCMFGKFMSILVTLAAGSTATSAIFVQTFFHLLTCLFLHHE